MADIKDEYTLKKYECGYCGYGFQQFVRKVDGDSTAGITPKHNTSSQVQCSNCHNFLKTWDEGVEVEKFRAGRITNRVYTLDKKVK